MESIEEFHNDFVNQIFISADSSEDFKVNQFFDKAMEYLLDDGTIEDYTYLPFQKIGMKIDGYELINDREILNLLLCDFSDDFIIQTLQGSDIDLNVKRIMKFITESIHNQLYKNLEETSPGYSISEFLYSNQKRFHTINIIIITNKKLSQRVKKLPSTQLDQYSVTYDIWDINRFYSIENSKNKKESLEIDLESEFHTSIPALMAHLSTSPYPSYLCVVNGETLAALYEKYGAKLLESNVRSFLQFRAQINKGIRSTINKEPEMFFAYNNGLTATADKVETNSNNEIIKIKNFQIVNGGQTTASLFNTKKIDKVNLSDIFVQMKLTIINDEKVNEIVSNISKFANTQNKVNEADFFSNDIYHIRMEEKSRRILAPSKKGELKQTKWFYERARGQYSEMQTKLTEAKRKEFKETNPKDQMFSKTDLAKYLMVWENKPQIVSRGAQKNFVEFGRLIVPRWNKSDQEFNDVYFMHAVAKIIIFKSCDSIVFKQSWYGGYKANIVAYTISTISFLLDNMDKNIDFTYIWKIQEIPSYFIRELISISKLINNYILNTPDNFTNISEWCKKDQCWDKLKEILKSPSSTIKLSDEFIQHMVDKEDAKYELKEAKKEQKVDSEADKLTKLYKLKLEDWQEIINWGKANRYLSLDEIQFLNIIPSGKYPSPPQLKKISQIIKKLEDEGMKLKIL